MEIMTVFIDGLKPDSIKHMDFLSTFSSKGRIKTELGYSNPCHASMYSGVYPNKHLYWFIWKYSPNTSPFKWLNNMGMVKENENIVLKYGAFKLSKMFSSKKATSFFGIQFLPKIPLKVWPNFDLAERKYWTEDSYIDNYPTIFEILRQHGKSFRTVGLEGDLSKSSVLVDKCRPMNPEGQWLYCFIGDIDPMSHKFGQSSPVTIAHLKKIDRILEKKYMDFEKEHSDPCFMLFSDHGHIDVKNEISMQQIFSKYNKRLADYIHFIDANYIRFWFKNSHDEKEVRSILSDLNDLGFILTEKQLQNYRMDMPDNRYGDLIFYLDTPYIFGPSEFYVKSKKFGSRVVSMHGYLPDYAESDGVIISSRGLVRNEIKLEDITPTIISSLGIDVPAYMDGEPIW